MSARRKFFILLVSVFIFVSFAFAEEAEEKSPIIVNGDKVEYFQDEQKVVGTGNVVITYEDIKFTCDQVTAYLNTKDAVAEGNVKLYHDGNVYSGEKVTYNFETKKGDIIKGRMDAAPWYGEGELISKKGAAEYCLEKGYVTSCDYAPPHYKIQSKEVKIFLNDKITAKNTVMYVGNLPLVYIPYYVHVIKEKKPQVTIVPGYDKQWGGFVLTKWRYHLDEHLKGYIHLDYREKKDFAWGIDSKYDTEYAGEGLLKTYYMNERTINSGRMWDDHEPPTTEQERYKVQLRHKWDITPDIGIRTEYHKFSDSTLLKDYFYRNYEEDELPPTYISALCQKPLYSAELRMDKRANRYETVVERLPEFNLDVGKNKIFNTDFYYKSETSVSNLDKKFENDSEEGIDVVRLDSYDEVSYLAKFFDFLSISPYAAMRQTYFGKDKWGEEDLTRGIFYSGVDTSVRFYKAFQCETNALGLDINGLRHIFNPVVKYYYNHQPTVLPQDLMQFDTLDNIDRNNGVRFEFENKLQTKRKGKGKLKTIDLARLLVTSDYLFKVEQGGEFTDIDGELELKPYQWLYFESKATYDHLKSKVEKGGWDLIAQDPKDERWNFSLGQRYELEHSSLLTSELFYKLNPKWKIRFYESFQFKENCLKEQEYSITRDLHCWTMEFLFNLHKHEGDTFWLIFRTKAFPEAPLKVSTTYRKPKTEAQRF